MFSIQSLSAGVLADLVRRQRPSAERTAFAWQLVVGPALARATTVSLDEKGVLTVGAVDARWTAEIERARASVLLRMQHLLGPDQITRLKTRTS